MEDGEMLSNSADSSFKKISYERQTKMGKYLEVDMKSCFYFLVSSYFFSSDFPLLLSWFGPSLPIA